MPELGTGIIGIYTDEGSAEITVKNNVIDMKAVEDYNGDVFAISAWTSSIKNITAKDNYATFTRIRNNGTDCTIDTPTAYTAGSEPAAVQAIIDASAINLK